MGSDTKGVDKVFYKKNEGLREALASCMLLVGVPPMLVCTEGVPMEETNQSKTQGEALRQHFSNINILKSTTIE